MIREPSRRRGWIFFGLGCLALGMALDQIIKDGWNAIALTIVVMFGKYLLGKIASTFFDDEMAKFKKAMLGNDPIKKAIWHSHRRHRHRPKFRECPEPACKI